jgi:hypothetical protein
MRVGMLVLFLTLPETVAAHGGGLDAQGCHTNRKTGDYHCHRSPAPPAQSLAPATRAKSTTRNAAAASLAPATAQTRSVYYANCTAARAAGAAPVRYGDPGYASHLDRDSDGIGCE